MTMIKFISALLWRVRGGLRVLGHKIPLNKLWFGLFFGAAACYLKGWDLNLFIIVSLATIVSYQAYGWGEAVGCVLGLSKPDENRRDCELIDDILDFAKITIKGHTYKLIDYPILWGWVWLSLRGLIMTFIIGLSLQNIPFMLSGLGMGTVYWIGGLIARKILKKYDKTGWNISEWMYGFYLGLIFTITIGG